jgi:glycosyltransferase involved in cell wall biosynthesis
VLDRAHASFAQIGFAAYEIIVCDNHSTDATARIAREHGAQVVYEPHNQISRARNTAAKAARGEYLIFLDGDTFLPPELLDATVRRFQGGQVCAGGASLSFDTGKLGPFGQGLMHLWNAISRGFKLAAGSYVYCPRQAWADVGGFDETVYAGEELLFSRKLHAWAKARGMRFEILSETPVVTSARKMEWYGQWQLLWRVLLMMRPGAIRSRRMCSLWYTRPAG